METNTITNDEELLSGRIRNIAPYFALCLATFAAYSNIFDNAFVFDDDLLIRINTWISGWNHIGDIFTGSTTGGANIAGGFYRPLQIFLYLVINTLFGKSTVAFHALNLIIHMANACLVYRIGEKLGFRTEGVFIASLLWALHPLHTEAVTYMSATADPLFAFFCLAGIVLWLPSMDKKDLWKVFPVFGLGIISKETTVMFPLLAMSCIYLVDKNRLKIGTYMKTWPLWAASLAYVFWRANAEGFDGPQTYDRYYNMRDFASMKMYSQDILARIYTFLATLPHYLALFFKPTNLHMERAFGVYVSPFLPAVIGGFFILSGSVGVFLYSLRKNFPLRPLAWGLLWFGAAHSPDTGLIIPMNSLFLEHWMYLPSAGLFLGSTQMIVELLDKHPKALAGTSLAGIMAAVVLSIMTYNQNIIWSTPDLFYNNIFNNGEESARARNNLALYYSGQGNLKAALEQFDKAVKATDSYAETRYNMALTHLKINQAANADIAIENLNRSLQIDPSFYRSYLALSAIYLHLKKDQQKADEYKRKADEVLSRLK